MGRARVEELKRIHAEGRGAPVGASNPYRGQRVNAAVWRGGYRRMLDDMIASSPAFATGQVRALLAAIVASEACARKDLRDPVIVLAATGLRRSELLALRWEDVDLDARQLEVRGSVVRIKGVGLVRQDTTKGGAARTVPLPQFAVDALHIRKAAADERPNSAGVIFPSSVGTLRDPDNFGKQWREVRDALGLPDVSSHSFRKTVATLIDDSGLSAPDRGRPARPRSAVDDPGRLHVARPGPHRGSRRTR